jgi:predicted deacylase
MQTSEIVITDDVAGEWRIPVLTFTGADPTAPKAYIQAALHASELPGVAALHAFIPALRAAEQQGRLSGDVVIVPKCNPIGASQWLHGELQGRFEIASRANFNRDYPLIALGDREALLDGIEAMPAADQLKRRLLHLALGADLVLDLHCDDESQLYAYLEASFWPEALDLAESFGLEAVLLSDGGSTAFEEAVTHAWKTGDLGARAAWHEARISLTMEFRGLRDVRPDLAAKDAEGLMAFLQRRGVVSGEPVRREAFSGPVAGLDYVQMIDAPKAGTVLFERTFGDQVKAGDRLATLVTTPGFPENDVAILAPVEGTIVTRVAARFVRRGDNLMKIASTALSNKPRKPGGALED